MQSDPRFAFQKWLRHHGRSLEHDKEEFERRLNVWYDNLRHLFEGPASQAQLNGLADITDEEFSQAYLGQMTRGKQMLRCATAPVHALIELDGPCCLPRT